MTDYSGDRGSGSSPDHTSTYELARVQGRVYGSPIEVSSPCWIPDRKQGELISDGNNAGRTGRIYDGPPLINPNTGRPYKGYILAMSRNRRTTAAVISASGVVNITVGSVGGAISTRDCVVGGGGPPVYLEAGQYGHVRITLEAIFQGNAVAASIQWTDGSALVAFNSPLMAPKRVPGAAVVLATAAAIVPEGAFLAIFQNACNVTWRDGSSGALQTFVEAVAPGGEVRVLGSEFTTDVDPGTVQFMLAPL